MVLWVFGYASLIWKAGFHYDDKIVGFIKGYRRTFHLACIDHRGTPEYPARAANLDPEEGATCWGIAYCIKEEEAAKKALAYLEVRECEYDMKTHVEFFTEESPLKPVLSSVLVFLTTPDPVNNKYYLGPAPLMEMAMQIATAKGPNGPNYEYLFRLEEALRSIGHEEKQVIDLATEVRRMLDELSSTHRALLDGCIPQSLNGIKHQSQINAIPNFRIPTLSGLNLGYLNLASMNVLGHMPCSPRLLKSRAT